MYPARPPLDAPSSPAAPDSDPPPAAASPSPAALLRGVRVLDLTNVLAGPFAAFQLALLGAEVVKVEAPGTGDLARVLGADPGLNRRLMGASFLAQNAGKRSIAIDLKHPEGRAVLLDLARGADALIENFRPGVMARLGLGWDALRAVRPQLVYCSISGFGQEGPISANPAYDQIVQGMAGVMSITGDARSAPLRAGYPVADTTGGLTAAFAVAAALFDARRSGQGRYIDVSMLAAVLATLGWPVSNWLIAGVDGRPLGNDNMTASPSGTFRTADKPINIAANKQEQFQALCRVIGRAELAADGRFLERDDRVENRADLTREIEAALMRKPARHWVDALNRAGVPAGPVLTVPEALALADAQTHDLTQGFAGVPGVDHELRLIRSGFRVAGAEGKPERPQVALPPPALGQHTDEILGELGYDAAKIVRLREAKAVA
jgi:crotonobetainyl-CoA:carnitine CoA-transferase CaiB-like acyl-CoA transferase